MKDFDYKALVEKLRKKEPFTFTRFGDGEILAIWQVEGRTQNCDGHQYFKDLGESLHNILCSNPEYNVGLQSMVLRLHPEKLPAYFKENNINIDFCEADILHRASIKGNIKPFFEALNDVDRLVFVAPDYLKPIKSYFKYYNHISVPEKDCWLNAKEIQYNVQKAINRYRNQKSEHIVVVFVASMPSNVIIDNLYKDNKDITFIDAGSVFDPFVDRQTRSYHKQMQLKKINGYYE